MIVYIPVEVPDDAMNALIVQSGSQPVTQSNYPSPEPQTAPAPQVSAPIAPAPQQVAQPDPWTGQPAPVAPVAQAAYPVAPQPAPMPTAGSATPTQPVCAHGPMRYVPAGVSQNGRAYGAFWGCSAQRNDPSKCKSVKA